jgi:hypothetical protein
VVDDLLQVAGGMGFKNMKDNYRHCGHTAQAVQDRVMGFCGKGIWSHLLKIQTRS